MNSVIFERQTFIYFSSYKLFLRGGKNIFQRGQKISSPLKNMPDICSSPHRSPPDTALKKSMPLRNFSRPPASHSGPAVGSFAPWEIVFLAPGANYKKMVRADAPMYGTPYKSPFSPTSPIVRSIEGNGGVCETSGRHLLLFFFFTKVKFPIFGHLGPLCLWTQVSYKKSKKSSDEKYSRLKNEK